MAATGEKENIQNYLESISKEVRYKGIESIKRFDEKTIPGGLLRQFKYFGKKVPKGTETDRRFHKV